MIQKGTIDDLFWRKEQFSSEMSTSKLGIPRGLQVPVIPHGDSGEDEEGFLHLVCPSETDFLYRSKCSQNLDQRFVEEDAYSLDDEVRNDVDGLFVDEMFFADIKDKEEEVLQEEEAKRVASIPVLGEDSKHKTQIVDEKFREKTDKESTINNHDMNNRKDGNSKMASIATSQQSPVTADRKLKVPEQEPETIETRKDDHNSTKAISQISQVATDRKLERPEDEPETTEANERSYTSPTTHNILYQNQKIPPSLDQCQSDSEESKESYNSFATNTSTYSYTSSASIMRLRSRKRILERYQGSARSVLQIPIDEVDTSCQGSSAVVSASA
mmetsp:Transcript_25253/g.29234  ORF Transcript_25253/g.29234 Transcript_25253/m.29234 type:complete len:329 (-) Transcript_25253:282-1268(-)